MTESTLEAAFDTLKAAILQAETALNSHGYTVPAAVDLYDGSPLSLRYCPREQCLQIVKVDGAVVSFRHETSIAIKIAASLRLVALKEALERLNSPQTILDAAERFASVR